MFVVTSCEATDEPHPDPPRGGRESHSARSDNTDIAARWVDKTETATRSCDWFCQRMAWGCLHAIFGKPLNSCKVCLFGENSNTVGTSSHPMGDIRANRALSNDYPLWEIRNLICRISSFVSNSYLLRGIQVGVYLLQDATAFCAILRGKYSGSKRQSSHSMNLWAEKEYGLSMASQSSR